MPSITRYVFSQESGNIKLLFADSVPVSFITLLRPSDAAPSLIAGVWLPDAKLSST